MSKSPIHRSVQDFLDLVNDDLRRRQMLHNFGLREFIRIAWPSLQSQSRHELFVWLFRACLLNGKLRVTTEHTVSIGNCSLFSLYSEVLHIGYLLDVPRDYRIEAAPNFVALIHGKSKPPPLAAIEELPGLEHILNNTHLSAYSLGTTHIIANINRAMADFSH